MGLGVLFQAAGALLSGWITYPFKVLPQITINWEMWACGFIALGLSMWMGHRFLTWLASRHPKLPSPWPFRTTFALTAFLLILFGASISMTGIVHQLAWLLRTKSITEDWGVPRVLVAQNLNNARQLKFALDGYASDHDGEFPPSLTDLITSEEMDAENLPLLFWQPGPEAVGEPWLYLGSGLAITSEEALPILVQPRPLDDRLIILRVDGSARSHRWHDVSDEIKALLRGAPLNQAPPHLQPRSSSRASG